MVAWFEKEGLLVEKKACCYKKRLAGKRVYQEMRCFWK